jgi:hypothetical protein
VNGTFQNRKTTGKKKKKQNQLIVAPIITVFPEEKKVASNILPIDTHCSPSLLIEHLTMLHELFLFIGGPICYASCLVTAGVGRFIGDPVLKELGFTSRGIRAGSWAAKWMASYAGAVPARSLFASLQSTGAAGVSWTSYGTVSKICDALCTASDFTEPRDEYSQ